MSPRRPQSYEELINDLDHESFEDNFELLEDEDLKSIQIPMIQQAPQEKLVGKRKRK